MTDLIDEILDEALKPIKIHYVQPEGFAQVTGFEEAKQAINEQTLKQVMDLIGEDELQASVTVHEHGTTYRHLNAATNRNKFRAELRQSAERIWK